MGTLFISLLTLVLLLVSAFVILIVLMQRTSQSGGMGAALGGGAAESAFGSDTNNMLTKGTIYGIIAFFLVALGLYLLYQSQHADQAPEVKVESLIGNDAAEGAETNAEGTSSPVVESVEDATGALETTVEEVSESVDTAVGSETAPAPNN